MKLFQIWTSGSGVDVIYRKSLLREKWTEDTCQTKSDHNKNKRAIVALNRSPVLVHQSYSVEGSDHLVEGNQACLFCSIVFERITRPYPLPPPHTNIFYIPNIKAATLQTSRL